MNKLPEVTKNLLAINVLMFLAAIVMEKQGISLVNILGLHFFKASDFAPYQLVTYMFMHGGFSHLFFNMFALYMFGSVLERVWGAKRFLIYYFVAGIGAGLLQEIVQYASFVSEGLAAYDGVSTKTGVIPMAQFLNLWTTVGASGAIYAILFVNRAVVEYDKNAVRSHVYVKFATPEASLLSASERSNRVLGISCLVTVPEASMCYNAGSLVTIILRRCVAERND